MPSPSSITNAEHPAHGPAPSPRDRVFQTADDLFYAEGIRASGIDRLILVAHVTKATFYKHAVSKPALIVTYLKSRHADESQKLIDIAGNATEPKAALGEVCAALARSVSVPGFRGDAFSNAAAEFPDPDDPIRAVARMHREWRSEFLEGLLRASEHPRPAESAEDLIVAYEGAAVGAYVGDQAMSVAALVRVSERVLAEARSPSRLRAPQA